MEGAHPVNGEEAVSHPVNLGWVIRNLAAIPATASSVSPGQVEDPLG